MNTHLVSTVEPGKYFTMPAYLDDEFILTSPEVPVSEELINRLIAWGFEYILCDGSPSDKMTGLSAASSTSTEGAPPAAMLENQFKEQAQFKEAEACFQTMVEFSEKVFMDFVTKNDISVKDVSNRVRDLIEEVRQHKNHLLRITELNYPGKNYLVVHSVKSLLLGLSLGIVLKLPNHRLIELGASLLLHEIGMIRLPPGLYMTNKSLTPEEKKAITAHTLLGFKILKGFDFPMSVCLGVLESHEHIDGTGYPRALTGDKISLYAKVISVCSSYVAMSSERPFRGPADGHNALLELLKNKGKRYDEVVLKALIQTVSLYPVGILVELNNNAKGMVVQVNSENPRAPFVKLFVSPENEVYSEYPLIDTGREGLTIRRPLSPQETVELKKRL